MAINSHAQKSRFLRYNEHLISIGKVPQNESVKDNQGKSCALICINIPLQEVDIIGDCILGEPIKTQNGYKVFVSTWSSKKNITIVTDNYYPLDISLKTTDGEKLTGDVAYQANILLPADINAGKSWIKFKQENATFSVKIAGKEFKSDDKGVLDINLPYGTYSYIICSSGQNDIKDSITLSSQPQIINIKNNSDKNTNKSFEASTAQNNQNKQEKLLESFGIQSKNKDNIDMMSAESNTNKSNNELENSSTNNKNTDKTIEFVSSVKMVDLGLSVLWADRNIDASSPSDYGNYYAWGETVPKDNYSEKTYKYYNNGNYEDIGENIGSSKYDVAHVKLGGSWRIPKFIEIEELANNCKWTWITINGINGYKIIGKNGNSIFLPATGSFNSNSKHCVNEGINYWSSDIDETDKSNAKCLSDLGGKDVKINLYINEYGVTRTIGFQIRPVCVKYENKLSNMKQKTKNKIHIEEPLPKIQKYPRHERVTLDDL
jgi:hypothetical protein